MWVTLLKVFTNLLAKLVLWGSSIVYSGTQQWCLVRRPSSRIMLLMCESLSIFQAVFQFTLLLLIKIPIFANPPAEKSDSVRILSRSFSQEKVTDKKKEKKLVVFH